MGLTRALGLWDVTTITAGTILGSAIFVAAAFVPREVPHPTLVLLVWVAGGLIAIAGALSYAELGTMFPEAGGQYHYLKQAFGPLWGFLFGWTSLLAIQAGPVAYLGVAFGDYLGAFVPFFSSKHVIASIALGPWTWEPNTAQLAGVFRDRGVVGRELLRDEAGRDGPGISDGDQTPVGGRPDRFRPDARRPTSRWIGPRRCRRGTSWLPWGSQWWRSSATSTDGTKRRSPPVRSGAPSGISRSGMIGGTALVGLLYLLVNLVYFRAMPLADVGASTRIGEEATTALLGPTAGRLLAAAVLVSIFGCISSAIIGASRLGLPMSQDAPAFRWLARIHPRYRTPTAGIVTLGVWSMLLVLSGSYEQLFQYSLFSSFIFHAITALALFSLRRTAAEHTHGPTGSLGYPWVPALFLVAMTGLVLNTLRERPVQSLLGVGMVALGVPFFRWRRQRT